MIAFDLAIGSGALLAPRQTLKVLGHNEPSSDAEASLDSETTQVVKLP